VEFKRTPGSVEPEDFVQFANSPEGGDILVGVEEVTDSAGRRMPRVIGCPINDPTKRSILDKAMNCVPPIDISITVERQRGLSFYRVHVPSGRHKPYCTAKGVYRIRADGRSAPLLPAQLLRVFLEAESETFLTRFQEATQELGSKMDILVYTMEELGSRTEAELRQIFSAADNADSLADEAMSNSAEAAAGISEVSTEIEALRAEVLSNRRLLNVLLQHFRLDNPVAAEERRLVEGLLRLRDRDPSLRVDPVDPADPSPGKRPRQRRVKKGDAEASS
jgi:hypothetical protein